MSDRTRMGRRHLRPRLGADGGRWGVRCWRGWSCAATRPCRRRLRLGPDHRGAARAPAARAGDRRRRRAVDDRRRARAARRAPEPRAGVARPLRAGPRRRRADAILSTATFHWINDHATLFARLRGALRDGGALVAQCGGRGNIRVVREAGEQVGAPEPFAAHLAHGTGRGVTRRPRRPRSCCAAPASRRRVAGSRTRPVETTTRPTYYEHHPRRAPRPAPRDLHDPFLDAVLERLETRTSSPTYG